LPLPFREQADGEAPTNLIPDNGIAERFHKTLLNEFYRIAFRKKLYHSIDELQVDLDLWVPRLQRTAPPSRPLVLRKDPDADLP
jgi:hypothetical protein